MRLDYAVLGVLALATGASAAFCTPSDIVNHNVKGCDCGPRLKTDKCLNLCYACSPQFPIEVNKKHVKDCEAGCRLASDVDCMGCGLWFRTVCGCVKDPTNPKVCSADKAISPGSDKTWIHLVNKPPEHDLISSTSIIPGILDMTSTVQGTPARKYMERGWTYAQERWDPSKQALAMNPWLVRTMEQVHIHLCDFNTDLRDALKKETFQSEHQLVKLANQKWDSLWCVGLKKGLVRENVVDLLADMIKKQKGNICPQVVGAGMMMDDDQRLWACATTDRHGPLGFFCKPHKHK